MNTLIGSMKTSASGLTAERFRMDVISSNIANVNSTAANGKDPYSRREVVLEGGPQGVRIVGIVKDKSPFITKYEPGHPHADKDGNVLYANVEPIHEMVNMLTAARAYEANIAAFNSAKGMIRSAMTIGKV